jgi:hypothetical protein
MVVVIGKVSPIKSALSGFPGSTELTDLAAGKLEAFERLGGIVDVADEGRCNGKPRFRYFWL